MVSLKELGNRICIIGCSNSGKSTLADALAKKLAIKAWHLDQYAHLPNTNWQRSSDEALIKIHKDILQQDSWIIDGNYSVCMAPRLTLATSVIWLDPNIYQAIFRYLLRTIKNDPDRPGRLPGAKKEFSFALIKWILFNYPKNRIRYHNYLKDRPDLLVVNINSMALLKKYYLFWGI